MAVSIVSAPNELNPVDRMDFVLQISDIGTHPIYKTGVYKLKFSGGADIMPELGAFRPAGGGNVSLSFRDELKGKVRAIMPVFGTSGVQNDTSIIKEVVLEFGSKEVDVSIPFVPATVTVADSDAFKVFGGGVNAFDSDVITDMTPKILSHRPKKYSLFKDGYDWIWLLGNGTINYKFIKSDGSFTTLTQSAPYDVNVVPLNIISLGAPPDTVILEARMIASGIDETYTLDLEENCNGARDNFIEIMYVEPLGGRAVMTFEVLTNISAVSDQNIVSINRNEISISDIESTGGDDIIYKKTHGTFAFQKIMKGEIAEREQVIGFAASGQYHIRLKKGDGTEYWAKFILDTGVSYNPEQKTLTASGRLARAIRSPLHV